MLSDVLEVEFGPFEGEEEEDHIQPILLVLYGVLGVSIGWIEYSPAQFALWLIEFLGKDNNSSD